MLIGSLLLSIVPQAAGGITASEVTRERLEAAFEDARKAVEKSLAGKMPEGLALKVVEPDEIAERVAEENLPSVSHVGLTPAFRTSGFVL